MTALIFHVLAWPTLGMAVLVFGFAPGAALRLIVLFYRRDNSRRRELLGELYSVPRIERPFWVAEQLEVALFEGLRGRLAARRAKRTIQQAIQNNQRAVSDGTAREFAEKFYSQLAAGSSLGEAMIRARQAAVSQPDDPTWLAYTIYGDPGAAISQRP